MTIPLFLFLVFTLLIPYLAYLFRGADTSHIDKKNILIIAHRGASGYAPENTLASFAKGVEMGADMVELDVHLTKDDSVVVMHDYNVQRTTNGKGDIEAMTFPELRQLDAGSWYNSAYQNEKVPTLSEVLKLVNGRAKVLIELKWPAKGLYKNLVEKVAAVVRDCGAESWVILQSFETAYLKDISRLEPHLKQEQLVFGKSALLPVYFDRSIRLGQFVPQKEAGSVNIFYMYITPSLLEKMHKLDKKVYAFTPGKESDFRKLISMRVDGIITNYPDRALRILDR